MKNIEPTAFSYLLMKVAITHFERSLSSLDQSELEVARKIAEQENRMQDLILQSPEAGSALVPGEVVEQSVQQIRDRYEGEEEFLRDLQANGIDMEALRLALERELKVDAVLEKVGSRSADISDIDIQLYYYLHYEKLRKPERRTVRHILVTINDTLAENTRDRAMARIEAIRGRAVKNPSRFSQQATQYSECPSALHGGMIGTVPRGQLFPSLDDMLFSMRAGEISPIIESEMGFHILLCEGVESPARVSLQELRPAIRTKLEEKRRKRCQGMWLKNLINGKGEGK